MLKIENTDIHGWETAMRAMRNPLQSWSKSDTHGVDVGENDIALASQLAKRGNDHAKFLRLITVTADVTAPMYWWKQFDTYKVGTVRLSTSTMHTLDRRPIVPEDLSLEALDDPDAAAKEMCRYLNRQRTKVIAIVDAEEKKRAWTALVQMLPESYNQMATIGLNYQVLRNIHGARKNHKLVEWHTFCAWAESLPYAQELICGVE